MAQKKKVCNSLKKGIIYLSVNKIHVIHYEKIFKTYSIYLQIYLEYI